MVFTPTVLVAFFDVVDYPGWWRINAGSDTYFFCFSPDAGVGWIGRLPAPRSICGGGMVDPYYHTFV